MSISHTFGRFFVLALCVVIASGTALAQSQATTGAFEGIISDESGAVVPNAKVTFRHMATGFERSTVSNSVGFYTLPLMPVGDYEMRVELTGFATVRQTGITLALGQRLALNVSMKVAQVAQTLEVTEATPLVETARTEISTFVDARTVASLPLNGRRFLDLALLTPTAQVDPERGQVSMGGQRGINGNINIDGADFNEPFFGGQRGGERSVFAFTVSQESIREFQVVRSGFAAEFGRSTGAVINVITKSGTNDFHGSAFYFLRHREFAPRDAFDNERAPIRQQFGGSLGGPIVKNRTFFYGVYDGQRERQPLIISFSSPPANLVNTPELQRNVSEIVAKQGTFQTTNTIDTSLVKVDHNFNDRHRLSGRYNYSRNLADNGTSTGRTRSALENNGLERDRTHTVVGALNNVLTPNLVHEFRGQYSFEDRPREAKGSGPNVQVATNEGGPFLGGVSFLPILTNDSRTQFTQNLSYLKGKHQVKLGWDFNRNHIDQVFRGNWRGVYIFNTWAGYLDTVARRANAAADQFRIFFGDGKFVANQFLTGYYAQDTIRVTRNVTLNLGFRHEFETNPQPGQKIFNSEIPDTANIPNDYRQFQPRGGLSWDIGGSGKTALRVSGGIFNAPTPMLLFAQAFTANGNPNVGAQFTFSRAQILDIQRRRAEFVFPFVPDTSTADKSSFFTALGLPGARPDVSVFSPDFRNPRTYQYSVGLDRQIAKDLAASLEYVHIKGVHLQRIHDVNLFPPNLLPDPLCATDPSCPAGQLRPVFGSIVGGRLVANPKLNPNYGVIRRNEGSAKSSFDALTLQIQKRYSRRFQFLTSYTAAWNRDNDSNERNFAGIVYENAYDFRREFNWGRLDVRHRFSFGGTWDLPGGFQVSGILSATSARPFTGFVGSDVNLDNQFSDRPIVNNVPLKRNSFRNRSSFSPNLRLSKSFRFGDRHKVELIADMFNFINREDFFVLSSTSEQSGTPGSTWGPRQQPNANFNRIRDASGRLFPSNVIGVNTPFQLQLAVKYTF